MLRRRNKRIDVPDDALGEDAMLVKGDEFA
jgi:hypothetical protein